MDQLEEMIEQAKRAVDALKAARESERLTQRAENLFLETGVPAKALAADARRLRQKYYLDAVDTLHYASNIAKERLRVVMAEEVRAAREAS